MKPKSRPQLWRCHCPLCGKPTMVPGAGCNDCRRKGKRKLKSTAIVVAPHLRTDLQRLFEHLEPFPHRRIRNAKGDMLALVIGGPDAQHRASLREHIKGGYRFGQHTRIAVGHPRHQRGQGHRLSLPVYVPGEPVLTLVEEEELAARQHPRVPATSDASKDVEE
jgi:hypothetical protein